GLVPVAKVWAAPKANVVAPGGVVFRNTDNWLEPLSAETRSGRPSPFRSATATALGLVPVATVWRAAKVGVAAPGEVVFSRTDSVLSVLSAEIRSSLPSPFRSASATDRGPLPVVKGWRPVKVAGGPRTSTTPVRVTVTVSSASSRA